MEPGRLVTDRWCLQPKDKGFDWLATRKNLRDGMPVLLRAQENKK